MTRTRHQPPAVVIALLVLATVGMPPGVMARPRPPLPPLPEFAPLLSRAGFDEPFGAGAEKPEAFHPAYVDLVEGWSGYALRRVGNSVTPFVVPGSEADGAVRFWFRPYWSSGAGPGVGARLAELSAVGTGDAVSAWSLVVSPDGSVLSLAGPEGALLQTELNWRAEEWHLVSLNFGPSGSALFIDGALVAEGGGTLAVPPSVAAFSVGSTLTGAGPAGGEFDEFCVFAGPLSESAVAFCHQVYAPTAARGPISPEEEAAQRAAAAKRRAEREAAGESGGPQMLRLLGETSECLTNVPVFITNLVAGFDTNAGWTVTFDVQGTNAYGPLCDIFTTTNLTGDSITNSQWTWLERGPSCSRYQYTNQPGTFAFYVLGTLRDSDNDGLTDAYEQLVSKTSLTNANSPRSIYEAVLSSQNPSNWFKLNEASLTNAVSGGAVTTLTNGGGAWDVDAFATGNGAFSFTNSTSRLTAGDVISGGTGISQGSMSLLFRSIDNYSSNTPRHVFFQSGTTTSNDFGAFFEPTNATSVNPGSLKVHVGGQTNAILLSNDLVFGAWYYLAMTWDETRADTNGAEVAWHLGRVGGTLTHGSINLTDSAVVGSNTTVHLGNRSAGDRAFRGPGFGALDQIAFWNRELTGPEVNAQFDTLTVLFQGPSKVFDLTRWELTLPVDETNQLDNTHKPLDIGTAWLNSGFKYCDPADATQKYFYLSNGSQMVFEAPWNGADQDGNSPATSLGSPRSELRETLANGSEFNWKPHDPASGFAINAHTLQATCRIEHGPSKVIFGQIHTETPNPPSSGVPAITLFHEGSATTNKRIRMAVYYSPDGSVTDGGGSKDKIYDIVSGVNLGDRIDYQLNMIGTSNSAVSLTATVATNGTPILPQVVNMTSDPGYSGWGATNVTLYFKAGCYFPKAATNSGTAKVTFSSLNLFHQP